MTDAPCALSSVVCRLCLHGPVLGRASAFAELLGVTGAGEEWGRWWRVVTAVGEGYLRQRMQIYGGKPHHVSLWQTFKFLLLLFMQQLQHHHG